jgi:hypothetical protein
MDRGPTEITTHLELDEEERTLLHNLLHLHIGQHKDRICKSATTVFAENLLKSLEDARKASNE